MLRDAVTYECHETHRILFPFFNEGKRRGIGVQGVFREQRELFSIVLREILKPTTRFIKIGDGTERQRANPTTLRLKDLFGYWEP